MLPPKGDKKVEFQKKSTIKKEIVYDTTTVQKLKV
jgi:hypothetical protein